MDRRLRDELRGILDSFLKERDFELIDLFYRYENTRLILSILVDRLTGGVTLDECAMLNNQISQILDGGDLIQVSYILEVSSPGLDRPLKTIRDFKRCIKRNIMVYTSEPLLGKTQFEGYIIDADESFLYIDIDGQKMQIPLEKITKAKQVIIE